MQQSVEWDSSLIQRYNVNGPRYTSYPTALEFKESFNSERYSKVLASLDKSAKLSLYIHIPFCWHVCYYCGCNKIVTRDYSRVEPYLEALEREMECIAQSLNHQSVLQIHWGGGTPTFLNHHDRRRLMNKIHALFNVDKDAECSIEIDPRTITTSDLSELKQLGFNRLSLGVQDFNANVQQAVNRIQSFESVAELVQEARRLEFSSISFDLIYGLPHQTLDSFNDTLDQVVQLLPDRLSVFNYAHLPERFKPQRRINDEDLPKAAEKIEILHSTIDKMQQAGYQYIGMDHFALPSDELAIAQKSGQLHRNFQGYTTHRECELIGFGVSSISSVDGVYLQNEKSLPLYLDALDSGNLPVNKGVTMSLDDTIRKTVIFKLLCDFSLPIEQVNRELSIDFHEYFAACFPKLEQFATDGLIQLNDDGIQVIAKGRLFIRNICMIFDSYIESKNIARKNAQVIYSKAV